MNAFPKDLRNNEFSFLFVSASKSDRKTVGQHSRSDLRLADKVCETQSIRFYFKNYFF